MVEKDWKIRLKRAIPRVLKAVILSILFYLILFFISSLLGPVKDSVPLYRPLTDVFAAIFIVLLFASELSHGTVFHHIFNFAKALLFIIYLIYVLDGGVLPLSISVYGRPLNVVVDVRVFLTILISILALGLSRNVLQTIDFLSEKMTEDQGVKTLHSFEGITD